MRQSLVIGNWKMHGSLSSNRQLIAALQPHLTSLGKVQVVVCPPLPYLSTVAADLSVNTVLLGAQNLCAQAFDSGAYTGEVSASMLADVNVHYVLVGHSERREYFSETNEIVAQKFIQAQKAGLKPVLCVGENLQQRESGQTLAWITGQLVAVIKAVGVSAFEQAVVAYEPVWAIGTGKTASPEQAQEVHAHIRRVIGEFDNAVAEQLQLLYGGSVKADNAASLFSMADIDGALVGGASLKADEFIAICKAAE
jgi:triosephosphate isomerase